VNDLTYEETVARMAAELPAGDRPEFWENWHAHAAEQVLPDVISAMANPLRHHAVNEWSRELDACEKNAALWTLRGLWGELHRLVPDSDPWYWIIQVKMREHGCAQTWWVAPELEVRGDVTQ
jgi:hypothetical protein